MLDESASHRVFKISELAGAIASQLILISRGSAVNLACTRRCLEEPVLSVLWEEQSWILALLRVLPKGALDHKYIESPEVESQNGWEVRGLDLSSTGGTNTQVRSF